MLLLQLAYRLNYTEFCDLLDRVTKVNICDIDSCLHKLVSISASQFQGLIRCLVARFPDHHRMFVGPDRNNGPVQYLVWKYSKQFVNWYRNSVVVLHMIMMWIWVFNMFLCFVYKISSHIMQKCNRHGTHKHIKAQRKNLPNYYKLKKWTCPLSLAFPVYLYHIVFHAPAIVKVNQILFGT